MKSALQVGTVSIPTKNFIGIPNINTGKPIVESYYDLTKQTTLPAGFKLSRMSAATYFNNQGVLSDAAIDEPRFDHTWDGSSWNNEGLLVEKQSTNYERSTDIANASYHTGNNRSSISNLTSPKFGSGVQLKAETAETDQFVEIFNNIGSVNSITTYSIIKENDSNSANFTVFRRVTSYGSFSNDFITTKTDTSNISKQRIKKLSADAAILSTTITEGLANVSGSFYRNMMNNGGNLSNAGNVNAGQTLRIYKAQLEISPYPSSFINVPSTSSVTRSQDNLVYTSNKNKTIRITYKRQDTDLIESAFIDVTAGDNLINVSIGCTIKQITVFNKKLSNNDKKIKAVFIDDFTKTPKLNTKRYKFSRLSQATYINSNGVLSDAFTDEPRFNNEWDGTKYLYAGLLLEKQSTNYVRSSVNLIDRGLAQPTVNKKETIVSPLNPKYNSIVITKTVSPGNWSLIQENNPQNISLNSFTLSSYFNFGQRDSFGYRLDSYKDSTDATKSVAVGTNSNTLDKRFKKFNGYNFWSNTTTTVNSMNAGSMYVGVPIVAAGDVGENITIHSWQFETLPYATSLIITPNNAYATRAIENLQFNLKDYKGSIRTTYKRQDTDLVESLWLDIVEPALLNLPVGATISKIEWFPYILTTAEKQSV